MRHRSNSRRQRQRAWGLGLLLGGLLLPVAEWSFGLPLARVLLAVGLLPSDPQAPIGYVFCVLPLLALGSMLVGLTLLLSLPPPPPNPGRCAACGYSLTGNTSGICPECGAEVGQRPLRSPPHAD